MNKLHNILVIMQRTVYLPLLLDLYVLTHLANGLTAYTHTYTLALYYTLYVL